MNTGIKNENVFNRVVGNMDVVAAFGILGIIAMIVIPISTGLLDILLTFNITFSLYFIIDFVYHRCIAIFRIPYPPVGDHFIPIRFKCLLYKADIKHWRGGTGYIRLWRLCDRR